MFYCSLYESFVVLRFLLASLHRTAETLRCVYLPPANPAPMGFYHAVRVFAFAAA